MRISVSNRGFKGKAKIIIKHFNGNKAKPGKATHLPP